jgi:hypothetical protein
MATSTTSNSGGQLLTSLKERLVEKLIAGLKDSSNGGPGMLLTVYCAYQLLM